MKRSIFIIALLLISFLKAEAQIILPQPSPGATASTMVGLTDIKIEYSLP